MTDGKSAGTITITCALTFESLVREEWFKKDAIWCGGSTGHVLLISEPANRLHHSVIRKVLRIRHMSHIPASTSTCS